MALRPIVVQTDDREKGRYLLHYKNLLFTSTMFYRMSVWIDFADVTVVRDELAEDAHDCPVEEAVAGRHLHSFLYLPFQKIMKHFWWWIYTATSNTQVIIKQTTILLKLFVLIITKIKHIYFETDSYNQINQILFQFQIWLLYRKTVPYSFL